MIRPDCCLRKLREKALVKRNVPLRLTSSTASQSASLIRINRPSLVMPALLTRISSLPVAARICSAAAVTLAASETLAEKAHALRLNAWTFCAVSTQNSGFRSTQAMSAPAAASFKAIAWPMPRPAPVTTAT